MGKQKDEDNLAEDKTDESGNSEEHSPDDQKDQSEDRHGEGHGNLRRRSDWFQKRHGGDQ